MSAEQRQLLARLGRRLGELAQQRPALIRQAATVEKMLLANALELTDCAGCVEGLGHKLWELQAEADALPRPGEGYYFADDERVRDYLRQARPETLNP